jgi:hypothetical protein
VREGCEFYERCGRSGHYLTGTAWVRCPCLEKEKLKRDLGVMFVDHPYKDTNLTKGLGKDMVLQGPLQGLKPHIAGALLALAQRGKTWLVMDAYRLIEIFLAQDDEMKTTAEAIEQDLLVVLLGFGDPRNRYLPELLVQVLARRDLQGKPTWVVLGLDLGAVPARYNAELHSLLNQMEKVVMQ